MTSRKSSGSMPVESAVEPTRSANITVTWRRSASSRGLDMAFSYFVDVDEVRSTDAMLYGAPMSHGAGLYNFTHVVRGARHVVPESGGFEADEVLALAHSL